MQNFPFLFYSHDQIEIPEVYSSFWTKQVEPDKAVSDHVGRIKRTWSKAQIQHLYDSAKNYCFLSGKTLETLNLDDYVIIATFNTHSAVKCMKKMKEISITGSLAPGAWSPAEDHLLRELVAANFKKWGHVAEDINKKIYSGVRIRNGKQCKERWINHLDPNMKRDKWRPIEDLRVLELYKSLGNKWSEISRIVGNRTDSSIKNRVKSLLNKQKQELNTSSSLSIIEQLIEKTKKIVNKI